MKRSFKLIVVIIMAISVIASLAYTLWWLEYGRYKAVVKAEGGTLVRVSSVAGRPSLLVWGEAEELVLEALRGEYLKAVKYFNLGLPVEPVFYVVRTPSQGGEGLLAVF